MEKPNLTKSTWPKNVKIAKQQPLRDVVIYETEVYMKRDVVRCNTRNCKNGENPVLSLRRETRQVWRQGYAASSKTCWGKGADSVQ